MAFLVICWLNIIRDFLSNSRQRVVLNGKISSWTAVNARVIQGFILGQLLLIIYINDLSDSSSFNVKLFADDTTLFSVTHDMNVLQENWMMI